MWILATTTTTKKEVVQRSISSARSSIRKGKKGGCNEWVTELLAKKKKKKIIEVKTTNRSKLKQKKNYKPLVLWGACIFYILSSTWSVLVCECRFKNQSGPNKKRMQSLLFSCPTVKLE